VDISKFNRSHNDIGGQGESHRHTSSHVKVASINLVPLIEQVQHERAKDLPMPADVHKRRKQMAQTSMGIHHSTDLSQQLNFFPKGNPVYQDEDITAG